MMNAGVVYEAAGWEELLVKVWPDNDPGVTLTALVNDCLQRAKVDVTFGNDPVEPLVTLWRLHEMGTVHMILDP